MALTITSVDGGTSTASGTALASGGTTTASVGDLLVVLVAADNAGAAGAASISGVTDSAGNTYAQQALINNTPGGVAADGATMAIFTAPVTVALASGTVTANFSPATAAKTIQVYRAQPGAGEAVSIIAADTLGTTPTATTSFAGNTVSVTNGDTIIATAAAERNALLSADSDTTNGSWSANVNRNANTGAATTSMFNVSQFKTVNATGNQQYNVGFSATCDGATSHLILRPVPLTSLIFNPHPFLPLLVR
jgi:hypothetical protein